MIKNLACLAMAIVCTVISRRPKSAQNGAVTTSAEPEQPATIQVPMHGGIQVEHLSSREPGPHIAGPSCWCRPSMIRVAPDEVHVLHNSFMN